MSKKKKKTKKIASPKIVKKSALKQFGKANTTNKLGEKISIWKKYILPIGIGFSIIGTITTVLLTSGAQIQKTTIIGTNDDLFVFKNPKINKDSIIKAGDFKKLVDSYSQSKVDSIKTKISQVAIKYFYDREVQASKIFELIFRKTNNNNSTAEFRLKDRNKIKEANQKRMNDLENQFISQDANKGADNFLKEISTNPIYDGAASKIEAIDFLTSQDIKNDAFRQFQVEQNTSFKYQDRPAEVRLITTSFGYEDFKSIIPKIKINDDDESDVTYNLRLRKILIDYFGPGSENVLPQDITELKFVANNSSNTEVKGTNPDLLKFYWLIFQGENRNAYTNDEPKDSSTVFVNLTKSFIPSRRAIIRTDSNNKKINLITQYLYGSYTKQEHAKLINNPQNFSTLSILATRSEKNNSASWTITSEQLQKMFLFDQITNDDGQLIAQIRGKTLSQFKGAVSTLNQASYDLSKALINAVSADANGSNIGSTGIQNLLTQASALNKNQGLAYLEKDYLDLDFIIANFNPIERFMKLIKENYDELNYRVLEDNLFDSTTIDGTNINDIIQRNKDIQSFFSLINPKQLKTFSKYLRIAFNFDLTNDKSSSTKIRIKYHLDNNQFITLSNDKILIVNQESFASEKIYLKAIQKDLMTSAKSSTKQFPSLNSISNLNSYFLNNDDQILKIILDDPDFSQELKRLRNLNKANKDKITITEGELTSLVNSLNNIINNINRLASIAFNKNLDQFIKNEVENKLNQDFLENDSNEIKKDVLSHTYNVILKGIE